MPGLEEGLIVRKIRDGTVIDHIEAGRALQVLKILGITGEEGYTVAVVMNVESKKLGKKDIVKVEGLELKESQVDRIALVTPRATINIIRNYRVVSKRKVKVPEKIIGLVRCLNPNCITNQPREPVKPSFTLLRASPLLIVCDYCGYRMEEREVITQLVES